MVVVLTNNSVECWLLCDLFYIPSKKTTSFCNCPNYHYRKSTWHIKASAFFLLLLLPYLFFLHFLLKILQKNSHDGQHDNKKLALFYSLTCHATTNIMLLCSWFFWCWSLTYSHSVRDGIGVATLDLDLVLNRLSSSCEQTHLQLLFVSKKFKHETWLHENKG